VLKSWQVLAIARCVGVLRSVLFPGRRRDRQFP
jgi:hypothetical protein